MIYDFLFCSSSSGFFHLAWPDRGRFAAYWLMSCPNFLCEYACMSMFVYVCVEVFSSFAANQYYAEQAISPVRC